MRLFSTNKKGFTLIELLVVIAIIAILAAILFPVFAKARERARTTSCLNNVKQLALAFNMYSNDYDETLPYHYVDPASNVELDPITNWNLGGNARMNWGAAILPYVKNDKIFLCPSATWVDATKPLLNITYVANGWVLGQASAAVTKPADTILLQDGSGTTKSGTDVSAKCCIRPWWAKTTWADGTDYIATGAGSPAPGQSALHNDMQSIAYADGHVKLVTQSKLYGNWIKCLPGSTSNANTQTGEGYNMWNPNQL